MVCRTCGENGHNVSTCKRQEEIIQNSDDDVKITLESDVVEKLSRLANICIEVAKEYGKGYEEEVYQECMCIELQQEGIQYGTEQICPLIYKGNILSGGHFKRTDITLTNYLDFIYELKALRGNYKFEDILQILSYLKFKQKKYGALVNYNQSLIGTLEIQFFVKHEENFYLYDFKKRTGKVINNFINTTVDYSPNISS